MFVRARTELDSKAIMHNHSSTNTGIHDVTIPEPFVFYLYLTVFQVSWCNLAFLNVDVGLELCAVFNKGLQLVSIGS